MQCLFQRKFPDVLCCVLLVTEKEVEMVLPGGEKGATLLEKVLEAADVTEREFFSLQYLDRHKQWQWLRHQKAIYPQWKDCIADRHSVTATATPAFHLRVAVKFYPNDPCRVADVTTRYHLFLQVRSDIASGRLKAPDDLFVELSGMILQSDIGDTQVPTLQHVDERLGMQLNPGLRQRIFQMHGLMRGREPDAAEYMFLDKVKWLDGYGSVATEVYDEKRNPCLFCLKPTSVYVEKNGRNCINVFWPCVTSFAVRKTCLMMKVKDKSIVSQTPSSGSVRPRNVLPTASLQSMHCFYAPTKEDARNLWRLCEEHHAFFKKNFKIRLMRSSSSATSVQRHLSKSSANFDEETRLSSRGFGRPRSVDDNGSVASGQSAVNGLHSASATASPALRRSSVLSDRGVTTRMVDEEMHSPSPHIRTRAVHLSDVENDSYISRGMQVHREMVIPNGSRTGGSVVTAASYEPHQNGLHGSFHSLASDPTGGPQNYRRARRRRSRPNSPPGRAGPAPELLEHIHFEPIEPPADLAEAQQRDIQYTVVQTNAEPFRVRYSPRMKQRGRSWLKPAPPPTEILPHSSGPVTDGQGDHIPAATAVSPGGGAPLRPLPNRPPTTSYPSRRAMSPEEAINRYANTLRAKQKDLMMRRGVYSPKASSRHPHPQQTQTPKGQPPPPFCFMATGHDLSYMTPPHLHNASYSAAVREARQTSRESEGRTPSRTVHQRMTLL